MHYFFLDIYFYPRYKKRISIIFNSTFKMIEMCFCRVVRAQMQYVNISVLNLPAYLWIATNSFSS